MSIVETNICDWCGSRVITSSDSIIYFMNAATLNGIPVLLCNDCYRNFQRITKTIADARCGENSEHSS